MPEYFDPKGVIPACLLPFTTDLQIDEPNFRKHLRHVAATRGLSALTVNAHSTEVSCCTFDEQQRVLAIAVSEMAGKLPVVNGVYAESTLEAQQVARMSQREGAAALLVFPPRCFTQGAQVRPEMMIAHHKAIADACDLPLIFFQFPLGSGAGTRLESIMRLCDEVPSVRATKDYCNDPVLFERSVKALQGRSKPVHVLTTHTAWLLPSLVLGCDGVLSGSGSTVAPLQVEMFEAVQRGDLLAAKRVSDRLFPLNEIFYGAPFLDMHNRMKEAQVLLGRLPNAVVRPPLAKLSDGEIRRIAAALEFAGLLKVTAKESEALLATA